MSIDVAAALAADPFDLEYSWDAGKIILYHLGIGAGHINPTAASELEFTYEANLKVLPSFAVVPSFHSVWLMNDIPGIDVNLVKVLHGEQRFEIHNPIPVEAAVINSTHVSEIQDKGKAAVIKLESVTRISGSNEPLFTNYFSIFCRGEGGFGGDPGSSTDVVVPGRAPDFTVESPTMPQQALLYRIAGGDMNPLHAEPMFAQFAGFDRPILHGLCTFGIAHKAAVDAALDGDVAHVKGFGARMTGVVFPGETIITKIWHEDGSFILEASTTERGKPVLSNCVLTTQ